MNRLKIHLKLFPQVYRYFSNWWVLYAERIFGKKITVLRMRNGLVFRTPNIYQTIPIIFEIFERGVYDIDGLPEDAIILDVGAYVGTFALFAAMKYPNAIIYCFEPEPSNFRYLTMNTEHLPNIYCFNVAVGDKDERRTLWVRGEGYGTNSLYKRKDGIPLEVSCITLGSFLQKQNISCVDFLKLDCEKAEPEIIATLPLEVKRVVAEWSRGVPKPQLPKFVHLIPKE